MLEDMQVEQQQAKTARRYADIRAGHGMQPDATVAPTVDERLGVAPEQRIVQVEKPVVVLDVNPTPAVVQAAVGMA